jgi:DNA-binding response OmpR family regulator
MRFALITSDMILAEKLAECLGRDAVVVDSYHNDLTLLRAIRAVKYDLVLIDAKDSEPLASSMLAWRGCNVDICTPVIVLTRLSTWASMLAWINAGATDVANRLDVEQIRLRIHILLQRSANRANSDRIELCGYQLRRDISSITRGAEEIVLTPREFSMAWLFFSNPGAFISRPQIAGSVWGESHDVAARTIEQHVYKLRKKLRLSGASCLRLKAVYALGFKLDIAPEASANDLQRM